MTTRKARLIGVGLMMALWLVMVQGLGPLISRGQFTASHLSSALVAGAVAFILYQRNKSTDSGEKKLLGRMLAYTVAGIALVWVSNYAFYLA